MNNSLNPIKNFGQKTSSAFVLDMRESTTIIRILTESDKAKLEIYTDFLMNLKQILFEELSVSPDIEMALNDTGDGFMCLLWNKTHALTALKMASVINKYLIDNLPDLEKIVKINTDFPQFKHGIGLHSGSSVIYRYKQNNQSRDFAYGLVINTAARIESFTKIYINSTLLASEYFIEILRKQFKKHYEGDFDKWASKNLEKVIEKKIDIGDAKNKGHILFTTKRSVLSFPKKKVCRT